MKSPSVRVVPVTKPWSLAFCKNMTCKAGFRRVQEGFCSYLRSPRAPGYPIHSSSHGGHKVHWRTPRMENRSTGIKEERWHMWSVKNHLAAIPRTGLEPFWLKPVVSCDNQTKSCTSLQGQDISIEPSNPIRKGVALRNVPEPSVFVQQQIIRPLPAGDLATHEQISTVQTNKNAPHLYGVLCKDGQANMCRDPSSRSRVRDADRKASNEIGEASVHNYVRVVLRSTEGPRHCESKHCERNLSKELVLVSAAHFSAAELYRVHQAPKTIDGRRNQTLHTQCQL